jgi:hypothetical protein
MRKNDLRVSSAVIFDSIVSVLCSYEGTVFDDLAHGKGVYVTPLELCRQAHCLEWVLQCLIQNFITMVFNIF